jgi:hypothetical protein
MKYGLIIRSYAPFESFGVPPFHGDARGPSTSSKVGSRMKAWVVFDPTTGRVEPPQAKSDESHLLVWPHTRKTEVPRVRIDAVQLGSNWLHFRLSAAGANPVLPHSPDIDVRAAVTVSVGKGHLNINAELTGDQFPNSEVVLQDEGGARRMLQSYETTGGRRTGPIARLPGEGRRPMSAICAAFPVDASGRFV